MNFQLQWFNSTDRDKPCVVCSFFESPGDEPQELFIDYNHYTWGSKADLYQLMKRVLSYHMGRDPDADTVRRFISRPTVSPVIVTKKELQAFFNESDMQPGLRI